MISAWKKKAIGVASVMMLALAGCSASPDGGKGSEIEVWLPTPFGAESTSDEQTAWGEILAPFEAEHDVKVNVTLIPWASYEEKYLTGVSSGSGPELGYMYTEMMGDYIVNGALASFDDLSADFKDQMMYLDQGVVGGKQYALPFVVGGMRMLYGNSDILAEAGVTEMPATWDDFIGASLKVKETGKTPILQEWGNPARGMMNSAFFPLLWQAGGDILTDDGSKTAFNSEAGLAAANFLMDQLDQGIMPANVSGMTEEDVKGAFFSGDTGFMYGTDATRAEIEEAGVKYDVIPFLTNETGGTFVASDSLVMLDACKDKAVCTDLAEFILSGDQMTKFHEQIVSYPPVGLDEVVDKTDPFIAIYLDNADYLHSLPIAAGSAKVYNSLYIQLQQMILGQKTPEQALKDAAAEGDAALQEAQQ